MSLTYPTEALAVLSQVAIAMLLGGIIGIERELAQRPAGLRTNMLVAGASCLLVSLSHQLVHSLHIELSDVFIRADPIRIIEAVVTGVSFIAAGTIIRNSGRGVIDGLTSASSMLFVAALGITVALSQITLAVMLAVLVLIVLRGIRWLERKWLLSKPESSREA